jgi:hypothetical protein
MASAAVEASAGTAHPSLVAGITSRPRRMAMVACTWPEMTRVKGLAGSLL